MRKIICFPTLIKNGNLVQVGSPTLPHVYNRDLNNFGPRVGITWGLRPNTVIRAAYGVYYDYTPQNNMIANYTNSAGLATNPVPSLAGGPHFVGGMDFNLSAWTGGAAAGPVFTPTEGPQAIFITDLNLRTPYVQSWNLNIQQQINNAVAFEVGYVGSKGTKLTRLYDKNQDFTNESYLAIDVFSGGANSTYNALQATARLQNFQAFPVFPPMPLPSRSTVRPTASISTLQPLRSRRTPIMSPRRRVPRRLTPATAGPPPSPTVCPRFMRCHTHSVLAGN